MRSDIVTKGLERAPHRSLFKAMGYTNEELSRPLIGVCHAHNEIIPGHVHLDKIVEAVKTGVRMAGCLCHYRCLRRYCHGSYRHEILPGQP